MDTPTLVSFTFVGSYPIASRVGRTFRDVMLEYESLETSFFNLAMSLSGCSLSTTVDMHVPRMSILRNDLPGTTDQLHLSLKRARYRAVGWSGVFLFAAQHPNSVVLHQPVGIGGQPFLSRSRRGSRPVKHADFMQARPEHRGLRETDLELQVASADENTGLWKADTNLLVTYDRFKKSTFR